MTSKAEDEEKRKRMSYDAWLRRKHAELRQRREVERKKEQEFADASDPDDQKVSLRRCL